MTAEESEYREALYQAQRALMHALKWVKCDTPKRQADVDELIGTAFDEVSRVLDIGRDEMDEMVLTCRW